MSNGVSGTGAPKPNILDRELLATSVHGDKPLIEVMTPQPTDDPTVFVGLGNPYGPMGIYGGHFLGQALAAGLATVEEPKLAHSFHAYFLQKGDPDQPIEYRVQVLRNGRGSDARIIAGWQGERQVFHMIASFKLAEDGEHHQPAAPDLPDADSLVGAREAAGEPKFPFPPTQNGWTQMEWASPSFREYLPDRDAILQLWMRVPNGEALTTRQRQIVLAFLSDGPLMFNSILPYGMAMETHWATSIDQSVWFHHTPDPSAWMLFDQRSTAAADGRGLNSGEVYTETGALVMTCAQESVLRRIPSDKPLGS